MKAIILILIALSLSAYCQQCRFDIYSYGAGVKPPLFIDHGNGLIKYPIDAGFIVVNQNDPIGLMCGSFTDLPGTYATLYCESGTNFYYFHENRRYETNILRITCATWPETRTEVTGRCMGNLQLIDVFFQNGNTRFPLYTSCYDPSTCLVRYVMYTIRTFPNQDIKKNSFNFRKSNLVNCRVTDFYPWEAQKRTFEGIFPNQQNYISKSANQYLAQG